MITCFRCERTPAQIPGIVMMAREDGVTPDEYAMEDGTYNPETQHFACDECYIAIGQPSYHVSEGRGPWKAP